MNKVLGNKVAVALMVIPGLVIYLCLVFTPIVWSFVYSLYSGMPGMNFNFSGFSNYSKIWKDTNFIAALTMNLKYVAIVTPGQVVLGLLAALMFHFSIKKYKTAVRTIVFFPTVLPIVAVAQMFSKLFEITPQYGVVNSLLQLIGVNQLIQPWLGQNSTAFGVLCGMDIWTAIGFYSVIIYGSLSEVPNDVIESARIDGANGFRLFRSILLPYLRPILITCCVFSLTGTLKMFESATALTNGGPGAATKSLSMYMYDSSFNFNNYGYGSSIAMFILAECLLASAIVGLVNRHFEK